MDAANGFQAAGGSGSLHAGAALDVATALLSDLLRVFQRNAAFVAFLLVVCFACFVYVVQNLRGVLIPLVWSAFFAVPLTALISDINELVIQATSYLLLPCRCTIERVERVPFRAFAGENLLVLEASQEVLGLLERVNHPCREYLGMRCNRFTSCCRRRVRITELYGDDVATGRVVNRLVKNWVYYIRDPCKGRAPHCVPRRVELQQRSLWTATAAADGRNRCPGHRSNHSSESLGAEIQVELFIDHAERYPAVLEVVGIFPALTELTGTMEVDRTSIISWFVAVVLAMLLVVGGVFIFILFLALGAQALQDNAAAYQDGAKDMLSWVGEYLETALPKDVWSGMDKRAEKFFTDAAPDLATNIFAVLESIGWQAVLFFLYLSFWIFEPLPINNSVAQVFKSYFLLKTMVCLLFASLMSGLLLFLQCKFWHLFFLLTFLLNYIPEIGPLAAALLMLPAILLDGHKSVDERLRNTLWLVVLGILFKVVTGNIIEVQMYATRGGEFMRMHPVVLMALMMFCEQLMGLTGMFLAVPIMAAVKYYLVSVDMPDVYLDPLLTLLEGDEHGPHKNFVDRHRVDAKDMSRIGMEEEDATDGASSEADEHEHRV